ncbi:MAG TPA: MOSC domain-containing protein [Candidatus Limnocylindria bacterium]|jgi:MOSC domain-containing protein YiiM|nr:MOSC domain-containing protein [Candidatus Limnocylindria bacterium]
MDARVVGLHLHERHGEHPRAVGEVTGRVGGGIDGDSHADRARRGVVVVDRSVHEALGLRPGDLREQITTSGLPGVTTLAPGTELRVGGLTLRVNGECAPCTHIGEMIGVDDVLAFQASLVGRRGAECTVIAADGSARIGDPVEVLPARVGV